MFLRAFFLIFQKVRPQKVTETCTFFKNGRGVAGKRHTNPDGTVGGWVHPRAIVPQGTYIDSRVSICAPLVLPDRHRIVGPAAITSLDQIIAEPELSEI